MNKVILLGRVGQEPTVKTFDNGGKVANFSLATDESYTKDGKRIEATEWHNISMNGKLADVAEKWIKKGSKLAIEGKIKTRSWDADGGKKYITEIHASTFEFCESAKSEGAPANNVASQSPEDDDLPF